MEDSQSTEILKSIKTVAKRILGRHIKGMLDQRRLEEFQVKTD